MTRSIIISLKDPSDSTLKQKYLDTLKLIIPRLSGNCESQHKSIITVHDSVITALFPINGPVYKKDSSIAVGYIANKNDDWYKLNTPSPDGNYAIFRSSEDTVELVTDALATRTIWFHIDDSSFIASTSERALVMLRNSFCLNKEQILWFLINGFLNLKGGWDSRFDRVNPDETVRLNRKSWLIDRTNNINNVQKSNTKKLDFKKLYIDKISNILLNLNIKNQKTLLPLSGGYDSRLIAYFVKDFSNLKAVTWEATINNKGIKCETPVAKYLANKLGIPYESYTIKQSEHGIDFALLRFVELSEGRSDNLLTYIDGFNFWHSQVRLGTSLIIRGDESFGGAGWSPILTERNLRLSLGFSYLKDHPDLSWIAKYNFPEYEIPIEAQRHNGESLSDWRHRLFCKYRVSIAQAAHTETESAFVDLIKPLQFKSVVELTKLMPKYLRDDKKAIVIAAQKIFPDLPYASAREGDQQIEVLRNPEVIQFICKELKSRNAIKLFGQPFIDELINRLPKIKDADSLEQISLKAKIYNLIRLSLPLFVRRYLRPFIAVTPTDPCLLAFRTWIILRVSILFAEDSFLEK